MLLGIGAAGGNDGAGVGNVVGGRADAGTGAAVAGADTGAGAGMAVSGVAVAAVGD